MHYSILSLVLHWVVSGLSLAVTAAVVPGFKLRGFTAALVAALLIGFANHLVWPILFILTLPLTIVTFGLFVFVIDAVVLRLCAAVMKDFEITSWFSAIIGAIILAVTSSVLHWLVV